MADQMLVTCFTDLKGSTSLTEELGHDVYIPYLLEHLSVAKTLAKLTEGDYVKNIGDANMVTFPSVRRAISFALQLQEFYAKQPCLKRPPFELRISLFLGLVEPIGSDVFGAGVNQAARLQSETEVSHITVNNSLYEGIRTIWGTQKAVSYFSSIGQHALKGISHPPTQELFSFKWKEYSRDNPNDSLIKTVSDYLDRAMIEMSNLSVSELAIRGMVIWPVVPRDLATAIHRGQTEIIRLLTMLGWSVTLLNADCGSDRFDRPYSESFCNKLRKYTEWRGVIINEEVYMSDLFHPGSDEYIQIHSILQRVITNLKFADLLDINNKEYSEEQREEIKRSPTLDFLRPALSVAAVLYLAEQVGQKCIVVAGLDERIQWERTFRVPLTRPHLGVLMNPVLKDDSGYQGKHKRDWPIWDSPQAIVRNMESTNLAWWTFRLHAYLPAFPANSVKIDEQEISPQEWSDGTGIPELLQKDSLARHVWNYLDPAL